MSALKRGYWYKCTPEAVKRHGFTKIYVLPKNYPDNAYVWVKVSCLNGDVITGTVSVNADIVDYSTATQYAYLPYVKPTTWYAQLEITT